MDDSFSKEYGEQLLGEGPGKFREAKDARFKVLKGLDQGEEDSLPHQHRHHQSASTMAQDVDPCV